MAYRVAEEGIVGSDHHVAHVGHHEAAGNAGALHLGNGGLGKVPDAQGVTQVVLAFPQPVLFGREVAALFHAIHQVMAGGEVLALGADDDHANGIVSLGAVQCVIQFGQQVLRFGVGLAGTVVADARDGADHFVADVRVFHLVIPRCG
ncbi:hypothetical protein D3C84_905790 [compost metagenome]